MSEKIADKIGDLEKEASKAKALEKKVKELEREVNSLKPYKEIKETIAKYNSLKDLEIALKNQRGDTGIEFSYGVPISDDVSIHIQIFYPSMKGDYGFVIDFDTFTAFSDQVTEFAKNYRILKGILPKVKELSSFLKDWDEEK